MGFAHQEEHVDENMLKIEVNIDDMNPEHCSYVTELLFEQGANDVIWVPVIMKKGRPGLQLQVLANSELLPQLEEIIFRETTTLGLRYHAVTVHRLARSFEKVTTLWGEMTVKTGYQAGRLVQFAPEFKECEQVAKQYGVALQEVYDVVRKQFAQLKDG